MFIKYYDKISKSITKNEDKKFLKDVLERLDKYIGELEKLQDPTNEERNNLFKFNKEEINHLFEITNSDFTVQIEFWKALPEDFINNKENIEIFENVLENKFGEYISSVNKEQLVRLLNNSRFGKKKYMLFAEIKSSQLKDFKALIYALDRNAFVMVRETKFVYNGFFKK